MVKPIYKIKLNSPEKSGIKKIHNPKKSHNRDGDHHLAAEAFEDDGHFTDDEKVEEQVDDAYEHGERVTQDDEYMS